MIIIMILIVIMVGIVVIVVILAGLLEDAPRVLLQFKNTSLGSLGIGCQQGVKSTSNRSPQERQKRQSGASRASSHS